MVAAGKEYYLRKEDWFEAELSKIPPNERNDIKLSLHRTTQKHFPVDNNKGGRNQFQHFASTTGNEMSQQ